MKHDFQSDLDAVGGMHAIPTMLDIVCRTTGMGFAAVARVTEDRWVACQVRDAIAFGLVPGGELEVESTICHEIRQSGKPVVIDNVAEDATFCSHGTPKRYGFQSYISVPIRLGDGTFFGTLCAIDPQPHQLNNPETLGMFEMFAEVIGHQLSTLDRASAGEEVLRAERETAALRDQFIAVLGHDLRNPLAAIDGGMRMLLKTPLNERATDIVHMMQNSAKRMTNLINDVLDLARGRIGGGFALERKADVAIAALLQQVVSEIQTNHPGRTIELRVDVNGPLDADAGRLGQLASNLLGNAITYGDPNAPVVVEARLENGIFSLHVANGGEPIPPSMLGSIFEPFTRGSIRPNAQGLGLGLYIAHEVANAHGGTLTVSSTPEETRFTFRMPHSPASVENRVQSSIS